MTLFNKNFTSRAVVDMVKDEIKRIGSSKIVSNNKLNSVIQPIVDYSVKRSLNNKDVNILVGDMLDLHKILKAIKLPGDFEKYSTMFHDLSELPKLKQKSDSEKLQYRVPTSHQIDDDIDLEELSTVNAFSDEMTEELLKKVPDAEHIAPDDNDPTMMVLYNYEDDAIATAVIEDGEWKINLDEKYYEKQADINALNKLVVKLANIGSNHKIIYEIEKQIRLIKGV